jgi:uncharacterized RDD family membrane protein YckC
MNHLPPDEVVRTPEGLDLRFRVATASERLLAFGTDAVILGLLMLGVAFVCLYTVGLAGMVLWCFLLRHGYFVLSEIRGNGRTIGKRLQRLRVVRADGGPLTAEVLLARNLTREIELFLPLQLLAEPEILVGDHGFAVRVVAFVWVLALLFFPLTNRQRLRIGDLLAGTVVVRERRLKIPASLSRPEGDTALLGDPDFRNRVAKVSAEEETVLFSAAMRREELGMEARLNLFSTLSQRLQDDLGFFKPPHLSDEKLVLLVTASLAARKTERARQAVRRKAPPAPRASAS